jgi:hypothetical protein
MSLAVEGLPSLPMYRRLRRIHNLKRLNGNGQHDVGGDEDQDGTQETTASFKSPLYGSSSVRDERSIRPSCIEPHQSLQDPFKDHGQITPPPTTLSLNINTSSRHDGSSPFDIKVKSGSIATAMDAPANDVGRRSPAGNTVTGRKVGRVSVERRKNIQARLTRQPPPFKRRKSLAQASQRAAMASRRI